MAFMKNEKYTSVINILESEIGLVQKTHTATQAMATLDQETGHKIIKAGTVFPANDNTAIGLVFEDVDMTYDEKRPISVIVAGRVVANRLPVEVASAAQTALKGITFVTLEDPAVVEA